MCSSTPISGTDFYLDILESRGTSLFTFSTYPTVGLWRWCLYGPPFIETVHLINCYLFAKRWEVSFMRLWVWLACELHRRLGFREMEPIHSPAQESVTKSRIPILCIYIYIYSSSHTVFHYVPPQEIGFTSL